MFLNESALANNSVSNEELLSENEFLMLSLVTGILGVAGFCENVTIFVLLSFGEGILDTSTNIFVLSLATSEIILCAVEVPLYICHLRFHEIYALHEYSKAAVSLAALGSLFLLTLNRFISIKWSLKWLSMLTARRAVLLVSLIWVIPVVDLVLELHNVFYLRIFLFIYFSMLLGFHIYMRMKSNEHRRKLVAQEKAVQGQIISKLQEFNGFKRLTSVSTTLALVWVLPTISIIFIKLNGQRTFVRWFLLITPILVTTSVLHPFIYFFRSASCRKASRQVKRRLYMKLGLLSVSYASNKPNITANKLHCHAEYVPEVKQGKVNQ